MKNFITTSAVFIALALCFSSAMVFADIAVIVHPANKSKVKGKDVKRIFLDQRRTFPGGGKVYPVDQPSDSLIRKIFTRRVIKKSEKNLKSYWSQVRFSGRGSPPPVKSDDKSIKEFVAATPGAIGYIDAKNLDSSVRVLFTFK